MVRRHKELIEPITLGDDDYDTQGRPKGRLIFEFQVFHNALSEQAEWIAQYEELPGYLGFGDTIERATERLWQDFGDRPHFRLPRFRRTLKQWERYCLSKRKAEAAGALIGLLSKSSEGRNTAARRFSVGTDKARDANNRLRSQFVIRRGLLVMGNPSLPEKDLERLAKEKFDLDMLLAEHMPWRLEHREARSNFPSSHD